MTKLQKPSTLAKEITKELFTVIGVEVKIEVEEVQQDEAEPSINITLQSEQEAGLLIGSHGATLHAIQSFISMAIKQQTGEWVRVVLDVDGWRDKQDEYLKDLSVQAADRARTTSQPQHLYNLNPSQRRTIHMYLVEEDGVETESQGEGESRYLVVKPA